MFSGKRVGIVVAVVLVVCVLLFCNVASVVEAKPRSTAVTATPAKTPTATPAKTPTALTISAPSTAPVKKSFSITGQLTLNGAPFAKSATVYLQSLNGNTWTTIASQSVTTGIYSFTQTETTAKTYQFRASYAGSATYVSSTSPTATVSVKPATISTALTISAPSSAQLKQSFSITGKL